MRKRVLLVAGVILAALVVAVLAVSRTPLPTRVAGNVPGHLDKRVLSSCQETLLAQGMPYAEAFRYWATPGEPTLPVDTPLVWVVAADCSEILRWYGNGRSRVVVEVFESGTGQYLVTSGKSPWAYRLAYWRWIAQKEAES